MFARSLSEQEAPYRDGFARTVKSGDGHVATLPRSVARRKHRDLPRRSGLRFVRSRSRRRDVCVVCTDLVSLPLPMCNVCARSRSGARLPAPRSAEPIVPPRERGRHRKRARQRTALVPRRESHRDDGGRACRYIIALLGSLDELFGSGDEPSGRCGWAGQPWFSTRVNSRMRRRCRTRAASINRRPAQR